MQLSPRSYLREEIEKRPFLGFSENHNVLRQDIESILVPVHHVQVSKLIVNVQLATGSFRHRSTLETKNHPILCGLQGRINYQIITAGSG